VNQFGTEQFSKAGKGTLRVGRMLAFAAVAVWAAVHAQSIGPTDARGSTTKALGSIDLAGEIDGLSGWQLRARSVTIEPGGHVAAHSHKGRPTMEYVVQGNVVEIRNGVEIRHQAGDMVMAAHDVTHWWENRGSIPVILVPVDLYKP
jgi:quercetin dioxygenase-like cupin family protein